MGRVANHQLGLPRIPSHLAFNASRDGGIHSFCGCLFQHLTTLRVKNFFLTSSLNLPSSCSKPFSLVLSLWDCKKSVLPLLISSLQVLEDHTEASGEPSLLQAKEAQLFLSFFKGLQPSDHPPGPPLDPIQQLHVLLVLRAPGMGPGLQMETHKGRAQGDSPLSLPAATPLLMLPRILLVLQLFIHQDPQVLLWRAALKEFFSYSVLISGITSTHVQHFALDLIKSHFLSVSRSLWMASVPSVVSIAPLSLVSSAILLKVHLIPLSVSSIKMLKSTGPRTDPWGTALMTVLHLDTESLTTTLWLWSSNQLFIHLISSLQIHLSPI